MSQRTWNNLVALSLAVVVALGLAVPVIDMVQHGERLLAEGVRAYQLRSYIGGTGPICGLLVYVLAAPVVITVAGTLARKLISVIVAAGAAGMVSAVTSAFESGNSLTAGALLGTSLVAVVLLVGGARQAARRRRENLEAMAHRVATMIQDVTLSFAGGSAGAGQTGGDFAHGTASNGRATLRRGAPEAAEAVDLIQVPGMVRSMALGVVWQAKVLDRPDAFESAVRHGLAGIRSDLERNRLLDPQGYGRKLIHRIEGRLDGVFAGGAASGTRLGKGTRGGARRGPDHTQSGSMTRHQSNARQRGDRASIA